MTTVLIDYGSGNLASAEKALIRAADGGEITVTDRPDIVAKADRIVLARWKTVTASSMP